MRWRKQSRHELAAALLATAIVFAPLPAVGQGCAQCKDNAAATPPATQRAYRHAILLLTITAGGLFVVSISLLGRKH